MKKVAFVVSHLGSESEELVRILNENPRVVIYPKDRVYTHPTDLDWLFEHGHKLDNAAAVYGNHLLHNASFTSKSLYEICKFIYLIRPAKPSINIIQTENYTAHTACRYYCFRLRRICEMAKRTPKAVFLTWQDLADGRGQILIERYLNLKNPLGPVSFSEPTEDETPPELIEQAQDSYERYYYYLNQQDLQSVNKSLD